MSAPASNHSYCVENVDRWVRSWDLLTALAESPRTSVHHLAFDHAGHTGPCSEGIRGRGGRRADSLAFADTRVDIESAVSRLPAGSLERMVIVERIARGGSIGAIAKRVHRRKCDASAAYSSAIAMMAASLGAEEAAS